MPDPHELLNDLPPKLYERLNEENALKIRTSLRDYRTHYVL
jgi:hypothetical protein